MAKALILIVGKSTSGKSSCLEGLKNHEGVLYLNCESGKKLPFRNKFQHVVVTDPIGTIKEVIMPLTKGEGFKLTPTSDPIPIHTIVIDSLTFLMDMYELKYVKTATDTRTAWGSYGDYFRQFMQQVVPKLPQNVIITAHTSDVYNEKDLVTEVCVQLKGSINKKGVEAFFNDVVACKKVSLEKLKDYQNDLLHITEDDELLGYKHVIQTKLTKETLNERIRGARSLWSKNETFIDGNVQLIIDRLNEFYGE